MLDKPSLCSLWLQIKDKNVRTVKFASAAKLQKQKVKKKFFLKSPLVCGAVEIIDGEEEEILKKNI